LLADMTGSSGVENREAYAEQVLRENRFVSWRT